MVEFSKTVKNLSNLFDTFRKSESKDEALGHLWKSFSSATEHFDADVFQANDNKFVKLASDIAKSTVRNVVIGGGLKTVGATEGFSLIPALFESVVEGVVGLFKEKPPSDESFFEGEWISVRRGYVKDTDEDRWARTDMFGDDDLDMDIPNYDVGFFIRYTTDDVSVVFDAREGKVVNVPTTDIRAVPDQGSLDGNEFLRDLKLMYFKKEGREAFAQTRNEISVGKEVSFEDKLWDILEFEPLKEIVHLVRDGEIVQAGLKAVKTMDQDNQLTWLTGKSTESFPQTLVKNGYCWKLEGNTEYLAVVSKIANNKVHICICKTGKFEEVPDTSLVQASSRFSQLVGNLPEFRRFQKNIIFERRPLPIWTYRHLCTQSARNRYVDKLDKKDLVTQYKTEKAKYRIRDTHEN